MIYKCAMKGTKIIEGILFKSLVTFMDLPIEGFNSSISFDNTKYGFYNENIKLTNI